MLSIARILCVVCTENRTHNEVIFVAISLSDWRVVTKQTPPKCSRWLFSMGPKLPTLMSTPNLLLRCLMAFMLTGAFYERTTKCYSTDISIVMFRENPSYVQGIGELLVQTARVTPQGVLVFFSSYAHLDNLYNAWQVFVFKILHRFLLAFLVSVKGGTDCF